MTLSASEEDQLRALLGRLRTNSFVGTPLVGGLPTVIARTSLPTAAKELDGAICFIPGTAGVADGMWICMKNASDVYGWVRMEVSAVPDLTAIDFLTGSATGLLSGEIVVGTTPGGELGGTWASPTVDTTHSGSAHIVLPAGELTGSNATPTVASTHSGSAHVQIANELSGTAASPTIATTHSGSKHSYILRGSNTSEQTTASTVALDLLTLGGVSIPVTSGIYICGVARKTAGGAFAAALGLKLNSTTVTEANTAFSQRVWNTSATNQAESGAFVIEILPRSTNYTHSYRSWYHAGPNGNPTNNSSTNNNLVTDAEFPNATITSIAIRGVVANAAITLGVKEVAFYEVLYS